MAEAFLSSASVNDIFSKDDPIYQYLFNITEGVTSIDDDWIAFNDTDHIVYYEISYTSGPISQLDEIQISFSLYTSSSWQSWISVYFNPNNMPQNGILANGYILSTMRWQSLDSSTYSYYKFINPARSEIEFSNVSAIRASIQNSWHYPPGVPVYINLYKIF